MNPPASPIAWQQTAIPGSKTAYVNSVAVSADGQTVFAGTYFYTYGHETPNSPPFNVAACLWDAKGNLKWKDVFPSQVGIYWTALSRDGAWAATGGEVVSHGKGFICAYDAASGAKTLNFTANTRANRVALSGDGSTLAAGTDDVLIFRRSGSSWGAPTVIPLAAGDRANSVDISQDGRWVAAVTADGFVMLIEIPLGVPTLVASWQIKPASSGSWVSMAAGGSGFVVSLATQVFYFDTASFPTSRAPAWSQPLTGADHGNAVAISDDGSLISAIGNVGAAGKLWVYSNKTTSGALLWTAATAHNPNNTAFDGAGKLVAVADGYPDGVKAAFYLFGSDGTPRWTSATGNMNWGLAVAANGGAVVGGSDDGNVYYLDPTAIASAKS